MIYLTYNDQHTSVYTSQVSDVCNFLNSHSDRRITLVAFISLRNFKTNRRKIKQEVARSIVVPMLPRAKFWKFNELTLMLILLAGGHKSAIARNAIAANMCLDLRGYGILKKVCLDGRGAMTAEWNEYEVMNDKTSVARIRDWEKSAVTGSDFRISVSSALIEYWKSEFGYQGTNHTVIPCTLGRPFTSKEFKKESYDASRKKLGYTPGDIVLVYAGSVSGWQSFRHMSKLLGENLGKHPELKVLFLSGPDPEIDKFMTRFPHQVNNRCVAYDDVYDILSGCDYGILYRENTVTNNVAAPTKFAEYLAAGLQVLISSSIFDYSRFVRDHKCGMVEVEDLSLCFEKPGMEDRLRSCYLARDHFLKSRYIENYRSVLNALR